MQNRRCEVCSGLKDQEAAYQKYGWEENNSHLPQAVGSLIVVRDFQPASSRKLQLRQCPACGAYYLYWSSYEYLVNGSEDEEHLVRLSDTEAAVYLDRQESDPDR